MVDVTVEIGAKIDKLIEGVNGSKAQLEKLTGSVEGVASAAKKAGEVIGLAFSVAGIRNFAERMGDIGLKAEQIHSQLGIAASAISELKGIAKLAGVEFDTLTLGIERISLNIQRATKDAYDPTNAALKVLGLTTKDLINLPADQYITRLSQAFSKYEASLNRTNALQQIGGRGVAQLAVAFDQTGESFEKFMARWKAMGAGVDITKFATTHAELSLLDRGIKSISMVVFNALQPAINGAIVGLSNFVFWVKESIKEGGSLGKVMDVIATAAKVAATAFVGFLATIQALGEAISVLTSLERDGLNWRLPVDRAKDASKKFEEVARNLKNILADIWNTPATPTKTPKLDAGQMNLTAKLEADMAKIRLETQRAWLQEELAQTKNILDAKVSLERITAAQRVVETARVTELIYAQELALLEKERALYPQRSMEWAKVNADIQKFQQKHATEMKQLQLQEIMALQQQYMQFLSTIQGAWDAQLQGLLSKTTTWAQAFKNILSQLTIEFIKWAEKKVLVWVATEAAQTLATTTGASTRTAIDVGAAAAASAAKKVSMAGAVSANAGETFGGVFAFLSPLMGPAAAAPATAAAASVESVGLAGLASFAIGAWELPHDMVAQVHKGEMIVPAGPAEAMRNGGGGGGGSPTFNIHALDPRSFMAFLSDPANAAAVTSTVASYQRNNPSSRGRF